MLTALHIHREHVWRECVTDHILVGLLAVAPALLCRLAETASDRQETRALLGCLPPPIFLEGGAHQRIRLFFLHGLAPCALRFLYVPQREPCCDETERGIIL